MEAEETRHALSDTQTRQFFILTHDWNRRLEGLKAWPQEERPNAPILFWSFRIMVAIGVALAALGIWSLWMRFRDRLYETRSLQVAAIMMGPSGFIAVLAGWITTEVGHQPHTVYGLLTTAESASPLDAPAVATSLLAFVLVYVVVFGAGVFYLLRQMNKPTVSEEPSVDSIGPARAAAVTPAAAVMSQRANAVEGMKVV